LLRDSRLGLLVVELQSFKGDFIKMIIDKTKLQTSGQVKNNF
jgi:hypothetical protein